MEAFEDKVIFSQRFPDTHPAAMLKKAEELARNQSEPDCVCISMAYHTHNLYSNGKKVDWW